MNIIAGEVHSVVFSRDGKYIISGSKDKSIKIFDVKTKQPVHQFADVHNGKEEAI